LFDESGSTLETELFRSAAHDFHAQRFVSGSALPQFHPANPIILSARAGATVIGRRRALAAVTVFAGSLTSKKEAKPFKQGRIDACQGQHLADKFGGCHGEHRAKTAVGPNRDHRVGP
jgi:hypothetical protein